MNAFDHIERIESKIKQKIKLLSVLEKEIETLKAKLSKLEQSNAFQEENILRLKEENMVLKAATGKMSEDDKTEMVRHINKYIKDVDNCIMLLKK